MKAKKQNTIFFTILPNYWQKALFIESNRKKIKSLEEKIEACKYETQALKNYQKQLLLYTHPIEVGRYKGNAVNAAHKMCTKIVNLAREFKRVRYTLVLQDYPDLYENNLIRVKSGHEFFSFQDVMKELSIIIYCNSCKNMQELDYIVSKYKLNKSQYLCLKTKDAIDATEKLKRFDLRFKMAILIDQVYYDQFWR